ncbi:17174_t:CDS:2, partial [Funneliformis caledonium]
MSRKNYLISPVPLFKACTVNPRPVYEIIKGVSLKNMTRRGISVKAGALGKFQ